MEGVIEEILATESLADDVRSYIGEYVLALTHLTPKNSKNIAILAMDQETKKIINEFLDKNDDLIVAALECKKLDLRDESEETAEIDSLIYQLRNRKGYVINDEPTVYNMNTLVKEVVRRYADKHPEMGLNELKTVFTGTFLNNAEKQPGNTSKVYTPVTTARNLTIYVYNQWRVGKNFNDFLGLVKSRLGKELGITIRQLGLEEL